MNKRAERFKRKLDGTIRGQRYDAQKKQMVRLEKLATIELVKREKEVKQITMGQPLLHVPYYIIFAKELYRIEQRFTGLTLRNEADILQAKWQARGLDATALNNVRTYYIPGVVAPPVPNPFRLDISLLDGPDVLV